MKAIVYEKYGPPEVLQLKEVEKPVPKDNDVLVKVFAASINDWDWGLLSGTPLVNRFINGLLKPKRKILGSDIAGVIERVGKNVKQFKPGDEVYGDLSNYWRGFAEFACAPENALALKPAGMTFEQAAAIPQAGMLAVQGLIDKGEIKQGQKLLINGAGGGVGTFGVQIAKLYNADVTGVDNSGKLEMMLSLGFDHVIDYKKEDFTKLNKSYDLILDTKTNRSVFKYIHALNPNGIYITVGGLIFRLIHVLILSPLIRVLFKKHFRMVFLKMNKDLAYINELFKNESIKPVIDGHYRLEEIQKAFEHFSKAKQKGKIVITVKQNNNA
jgi:NADPH:quinone reductase-like Zn-dependent oxidoreductase